MASGDKGPISLVENLFTEGIPPSDPKEDNAAVDLRDAQGQAPSQGNEKSLTPGAQINSDIPLTPVDERQTPIEGPSTTAYTFDPSKVPPKNQWWSILQAILPSETLGNEAAAYDALRKLALSDLEEGPRQLVLHLLADQKKKAQAMEDTGQPVLSQKKPEESMQIPDDQEKSGEENPANESDPIHDNALNDILAFAAAITELDNNNIQRIQDFLAKYPQDYKRIMDALGLEFFDKSGYATPIIENIIKQSRSGWPNDLLPGVVLNRASTFNQLHILDAFHIFHLVGGNRSQQNYFRLVASLKAGFENSDFLSSAPGLNRYLSILHINQPLNRIDDQGLDRGSFKFTQYLHTPENMDESIPDETMKQFYPEYDTMTENEKNIAQAEIHFAQNFTKADFNLLNKPGNNSFPLFLFIFQGERSNLIRDPEVKKLVVAKLLNSFKNGSFKRSSETEQ